MNDSELEAWREWLEVTPEVSRAELERAFLRKNMALIQAKNHATEEQRPEIEAQLVRVRAAFAELNTHVGEREKAAARARIPVPPVASPPILTAPERHEAEGFALFTFDNWKVNTFVPPLLLALVWLVNLTPLKFFLTGFHVWMHEFGHATAAWMSGRRALPLPLGWTPVEPSYSPMVHWGLLLLFVTLFVAGWLERKVWPIFAAVALAALQHYMTWRMPEHRQEFWWGAFGGVGGEFYLSTLFMMFFFVQLPEKFRWGACRYVLFFIGATAFLNIWIHWGEVYRGLEEIPFGSMINGEDDAGGDMNKLVDDYGWKKSDIRRNYYRLGQGCWVALGLTWAMFALRLNRVADVVVEWWTVRKTTESA